MQQTERALTTPDALRVDSTLTLLLPLISADMFKAHASPLLDDCGVTSINKSRVRLNRPHVSSKHSHLQIHR